jgi:hypothetical protein
VIKLDGGQCVRCGRGRTDGAILQVHHKGYAPERLPWEYGHTECETLCKGCHAQEHGIIMPQSDWTLLATDDLGELCGHCEYCDTELRYIYAITHPKWGSMAVGTDCCDRLTMSSTASEHHAKYVKERDRRARFVNSKRWNSQPDGWHIKRKGISFAITPEQNRFRIALNDISGRADYETLMDAKLKVLDLLDSGEAHEFLKRRAEKLRKQREAALESLRWSLAGA